MNNLTENCKKYATLSVCIITLNEEHSLPRCLASIEDIADQIVVVDSLSNDRTFEIAISAGAEVWEQEFLGYEKQKQFALEKATCDFILFLDADEWLDEEARGEIVEALRSPSAQDWDGCSFRYLNFYLGRWIRHSGWSDEWKLRFIRAGSGRWVGGDPHERLEVPGRTKHLKGRLCHYSCRSLSQHIHTLDHYTDLIAQRPDVCSSARIYFGILLEPPLVFLQKFFIQRGFIDGVRGFILSCITAFYFFLKYAKLWEKKYSKNIP